nr:MAG TPA: hypothetical protein [Bacteriophage sp.]
MRININNRRVAFCARRFLCYKYLCRQKWLTENKTDTKDNKHAKDS